MKCISSDQEFLPIEKAVDRVLDRSKTLPVNVFKGNMHHFLFITFDELFMPLFFVHIQRYVAAVGENYFWLTAIDPDPKLYFGAHFEFYGAFEFSSLDTVDNYLSALNAYPSKSPADALAHNTNSLLVSSSTGRWAIFGDRGADIAICAFVDRAQMELFKVAYGPDLLPGIRPAAEYAYGELGNPALIEDFCRNFAGQKQ